MRYLSLFSGIEAASVAWKPLGWEPVAFAEIEPFPSAVLAHHYPSVPNLGDVTKIDGKQFRGRVDLCVGGFPCQDLSVAGQRKGLKDGAGNATRSGLFFDALRVADDSGARFLLVENVPGLFSSHDGKDFALVVGAMAGCEVDVPRDGWRNAGVLLGPRGLVEWCVLDAQFFGVPQRRKRVFIVRDSGNWAGRPPILLEPSSLRWNPPPSRAAGQRTAACLTRGADSSGKGGYAGRRREDDENIIPDTVGALTDGAHMGGGLTGRTPTRDESSPHPPLLANPLTARMGKGANTTCDEGQTLIPTGGFFDEPAKALRAQAQLSHQEDRDNLIVHSLRGEGHDASEDGTGRGVPLVANTLQRHHGNPQLDQTLVAETLRHHPRPGSNSLGAIAFDCKAGGDTSFSVGDKPGALRGDGHGGGHAVIAFDSTQVTSKANYSNPKPGDPCHPLAAKAHPPSIACPTLTATNDPSRSPQSEEVTRQVAAVHAASMRVRRLTPRECERLQGFPDDYTLIPYRKKPAADGPRYKAIGNSMPVPVMRWLGRRIELVDALTGHST